MKTDKIKERIYERIKEIDREVSNLMKHCDTSDTVRRSHYCFARIKELTFLLKWIERNEGKDIKTSECEHDFELVCNELGGDPQMIKFLHRCRLCCSKQSIELSAVSIKRHLNNC